MSRSLAQFCDTGALLRRLKESNAPYFRKRLTSAMLKKSGNMEIPRKFAREHGARFHRVLSLTGPNGKSRSVTPLVRGDRVYLREWVGFARESGFRRGDEVIFWLAESASLHVALCSSQFLEKATSTRIVSDEAGGTSAAITSETATQGPKLARQDLREGGTSASNTDHEEIIRIPPSHVHSNTVSESQEGIVLKAQFCDTGAPRRLNESNAPFFRTRAMLKQSEKMPKSPKKIVHEHGDGIHRVLSEAGGTGDAMTSELRPPVPAGCAEAVPPQKQTSNVRKEEFVKYPGLNSAFTANSRFPQFVKRLTACNLKAKKPTGLEFPVAFVEEHGDKMHEHVTMLGASDHLRVLKLQITSFAGCGRVHLGKGWRDFSLENGYSEGDVLLFSLVGISTFVVKTFPGATRPDVG